MNGNFVYEPLPVLNQRVFGVIKLLRPHQWVKNLFVVAPVFFNQDLIVYSTNKSPTLNSIVCIKAALAALIFCFLASSIYVLNDLMDVEADRIHPIKRRRPIASGAVSKTTAKALIVGLSTLSLCSAFFFNIYFGVVAVLYFLENVAYCFKFKSIPFVDIILISIGFVLRVFAGGFATNTKVSTYMIACTALLALFLGFGKRRHELNFEHAGKQRKALNSYTKNGLNGAMIATGLATAGTYLAYTLDPKTKVFFQSDYLWLTVPFTIFGILRFVTLVNGRTEKRSGKKIESPTQAMINDVPFVLNLMVWTVIIITIVYHLQPTYKIP